MKAKTIIFLGSVLVSCVTTEALGEFGQPVRASEIIGSAIKDSQDQRVGTVKDLAIDLENGRIVEVVVGWGGFLGLDNHLVASPPDNFSMGADRKTLRLNLDKKTLRDAPVVDMSKWKDAMGQARVERVYQYYGLTPYFRVEEHLPRGSSPPATRHLGEVERASRLIGMETRNHQDQKIGRVENVMIDIPEGRAVEVIVNSGRFLDMPDELSALPPQALHFDADRDVLTVGATKEALSSAPHFLFRAWPAMGREQATEVYQAYHVVPYFLPIGMDSSAHNAPDVSSKKLTPPEQGTSPADLEITARIQKEILSADGLSLDARAVKVITLNGRVTLQGAVASTAEKRLVGEIAARIVPATNVDNQLVVKETANAAK